MEIYHLAPQARGNCQRADDSYGPRCLPDCGRARGAGAAGPPFCIDGILRKGAKTILDAAAIARTLDPNGGARSLQIHSVLFADAPQDGSLPRSAPDCFSDLHLDDIVRAVTFGREEYDLAPFFYMPLPDPAAVAYRHAVLRDLEDAELSAAVEAFAREMRSMRVHIARSERLYYDHQKAAWFLDAAEIYCGAVQALNEALGRAGLASQGLMGIREHLASYVRSQAFTGLCAEVRRIREALDGLTYRVHLQGSRITVSPYEPEPDYSAEIQETFRKFRQGEVKDYRVAYTDVAEMNHVEHRILLFSARLHPDIFRSLLEFREHQKGLLDETVRRFDREVQFYLGYLDATAPLRAAGLALCRPAVSADSKAEHVDAAFDLALALQLVPEGKRVVCNDVHLAGAERVLVVSGPNQGGKTTYARAFGQLHHLASLGLPVPGKAASLLLCDRIFTHFEREEQPLHQRGKLQDELVRLQEILGQATSRSVVILNESFSSTTLKDAAFIGRRVLENVVRRDMLCIYVTFIDELSRLGEAVVSMGSTVVPEDPATRTFKVVRKRADGLAHALAIAEKHGLSYEALRGRIG